MSFYIDEKAKHRDSEVPSINPKEAVSNKL